MNNKPAQKKNAFTLNEDWLSVLLAFLLILFSVLGVLGESGIQINF